MLSKSSLQPAHGRLYTLSSPTLTSTPHLYQNNRSAPRKNNMLDRLFTFLRQRQPTPSLLSNPLEPNTNRRSSESHHNTSPTSDSSKTVHETHLSPAPATWKHWKKVSLDLYLRLLHTPKYSRLRLKQTIAPLPFIKLKPVIDLAYRGPQKSPLTMHLDVKMLDCIKYRLHTDGSSHLQLRAKAPLSDPRFTVDVIYERQLATSLDSVKITFRALHVAFLKAPSPGFGCKIPVRFNSAIKSTLRVKKFVHQQDAIAPTSEMHPNSIRRGHLVVPKARTLKHSSHTVSRPGSAQNETFVERRKIGIFGPVGIDIKLRCLEYR